MNNTFSKNQKMLYVEPQGNICFNCDFCRSEFRGDRHYCELQAALSRLNDCDDRDISDFVIGCVYTTCCQYFTRKSAMEALMSEESFEKFEITKSLGKFDGIPELVIDMRRNWFLDKCDASGKQLEYSRYLADLNGLIVPAKMDGCGYYCQISRCEDKSILRSWISAVVPKLNAQMM